MEWSWSQCIKSHHARTSSGKGLPSHFWKRNNVRSILPGLRRKRTGLLLSWSIVFYQSKVNAAIYQEILEHFMLPSSDKLYGDADFLFQQDFSTCPQWQNHFQVLCWPWYYCAWLASQHAWPEPHRESMGYFQYKDEKQWIQQSRRAEGSIVPQQSHRLIASMPHLTDAGVCSKGAPTKYWVLKSTYFKELFFLIDLRKYSSMWPWTTNPV